MLSPGQWHQQIPKDPRENLEWRVWLLKRAREKPRTRQGLLEICSKDILFFVNAFVYQFNPLKQGVEVGPFVTWDFQDEALLKLLWCIENDKTAVIEKSREMGGTYLCLLLFDWISLFHKWKKFLVISRSAEAVDNPGDPDCVFWKLDHIHEYLPDWLKGPITRTKNFFGYGRTNSKITGQASTGKAGVGGRATAMLIDEFSQIKEDKEVRQRTASTTNCRIFNGTHLGMGTEFYELCQQPEMVKIQMHWTQHPDKKKGLYRLDARGRVEVLDKQYAFPHDFKFVTDGSPVGGPFPGVRSPWYDSKAQDIGDSRGVAMDLDINPSGSVSQFFNAIRIRELVLTYCTPPVWEGDMEYDHDTGIPDRLVERKGGPIKMWIHPDGKGRIAPGKFAVTCDNSAGTGATPTCLSVGNCETKEKVLEYANPFMDAKSAAPFAIALCKLFCDSTGLGAKLCWELPGPGVTFGNTVRELDYSNVYRRIREDKLTKKVTEAIGWASNPTSKLALLEEYRHALEGKVLLNRSEAALKDCLAYQYTLNSVEHAGFDTKNDPSGARVNHGDKVMADAQMWMLMKAESGGRKAPVEKELPENSVGGRRKIREDRARANDQWE